MRMFPEYGDYYNYGGGYYDSEFFIGLVLFFGVIIFITLALSVAMYILRSMALYKLAVRRGLSNPGLAWIPTVGIYRAGTIADDINLRAGSRTYLGRIVLGGYIFASVISYAISVVAIGSAIYAVSALPYWGSYGPSFPTFDFYTPIIILFNSLSSLVGIAAYVFLIISLHKIFKTYRPQSSTLWTVLCVLLPILQPFFLFAIRNAEPMPEWHGPPMYYPPIPPPPMWQPPMEAPPENNNYPEA